MIRSNSHEQDIAVDKKQRKRSVFNSRQIRHLEEVFDRVSHYPDLPLRQHLAQSTQLPDKKIQVRHCCCRYSHLLSAFAHSSCSTQIWFQNRRAKWRKQHRLRHFGGLDDLTVDGRVDFVPAPKSTCIALAAADWTQPSIIDVKRA
jgi:hypothetical protein